MQELRSTQILDNEILNDARKKAQKILEQADLDCASLLSRVDDDIKIAEQKKMEFYNQKIENYKKDLANSIPLEKQRFLVSYIQKALYSQFDEYLNSLSDVQKIDLVTRKFDFANLQQKSTKINAYVYGFDFAVAKKFLDEKLSKQIINIEKTEFRKIIDEQDYGFTTPQGIILEAQDKSFRIRLTINEIAEKIFDVYRNDLACALFGGSL